MSDLAHTTLWLMKLHQQQRVKIENLSSRVIAAARAQAEEAVRNQAGIKAQDLAETLMAPDEPWPALTLAAALAADLPDPETQDLLKRLPPDLRDDLTDRLYSFDALSRLDDRSIQRVLAHVDARTLGIALIGCDDELMAVVTKNMSSRAAEMLREDIDSYLNAGEISTIDVRLARESISHSIRVLYLDGEIGA